MCRLLFINNSDDGESPRYLFHPKLAVVRYANVICEQHLLSLSRCQIP